MQAATRVLRINGDYNSMIACSQQMCTAVYVSSSHCFFVSRPWAAAALLKDTKGDPSASTVPACKFYCLFYFLVAIKLISAFEYKR
jgi:hypothetical protein